MKKALVISIKKEIAPVISSRDIINRLARAIEEADSKKIMLDFNKVEFVSRSATHALIKLKEKYNKSWNIFWKKKIVFININRSFEKMVQSVVASKKFMNRKVEFNPEMVSADALFDKNIV